MPCSSIKIALMRLAIPEQPSECPMFGFTEVMKTPFSAKTFPTAAASIGSPTDVPVP